MMSSHYKFLSTFKIIATTLLLSLLSVSCGGGGTEKTIEQPSSPPPVKPPVTPPIIEKPLPEPLNCNNSICDSFENGINAPLSISHGKGTVEISSAQVNNGQKAIKFISNNTLNNKDIIPSSNTVLSLTFNNNTIIDDSTNKQNITPVNTLFTEGIDGSGLLFSGNNNYLSVNYSSTLSVSRALSLSVWYKHQNQDTSGFYSLVEQSANELGGHSRYGTWVKNNQITTCIEPDTCPAGAQVCQRCVNSQNLKMTENNWYHIANTYDGQNLKLFVNGELNNSQFFDRRTGISTRDHPLTVGADLADLSPTYLKGTIDEITIANTAVSDNNIKSLYKKFATEEAMVTINLEDKTNLSKNMWGRMMVYIEPSINELPHEFILVEALGKPKSTSVINSDTTIAYRYGFTHNNNSNDTLVASYDTLLDQNADGVSDVHTDCSTENSATILPTHQWVCLEWNFNNESNQLTYFLDEQEVIKINSQGDTCAGNDLMQVWEAPEKFTQLRIGLKPKNTSAIRTMYIDDIKLSTTQINCE